MLLTDVITSIDWKVVVIIGVPLLVFYLGVRLANRRGYTTYPYLLFLSSYLPLYPVLMGNTLDQQYMIAGRKTPSVQIIGHDWSLFTIISLQLFIIAIIYLGMILYLALRRAGQPQELEFVEDITPVANEYVLVYIFPLLVLDYAKLFDISVFLLVFISIAIIQVRTDRYMINPILVLLGYKFYYARTDGTKIFFLSRGDYTEGDTEELSQITIGNKVKVDTGRL